MLLVVVDATGAMETTTLRLYRPLLDRCWPRALFYRRVGWIAIVPGKNVANVRTWYR